MSFPLTRLSVLEAMKSADRDTRTRALGDVALGYWRPVCAYVAARWEAEPADAEDLTGSFFEHALLSPVIERYDPARSRFRTYLRLCVDGHVMHARAADRRLKRGGGIATAELNGREVAPDVADALFEREWVHGVLSQALDLMRQRLAARERAIVYQVFVRYDIDGVDAVERPTYAALAAELDVPVTQVTNYLAAARREFRAAVLDRLRATTASDAEFRREARALLGTGGS